MKVKLLPEIQTEILKTPTNTYSGIVGETRI